MTSTVIARRIAAAIATSLLSASALHAQLVAEGDVPVAARQALAAQFAGGARWHVTRQREYDAEFNVRGAHTMVRYTSAGQVVETRHEMGAVDLPPPVRSALLRELKGMQLGDAWKVEFPGTVTVVYLVNAALGARHVAIRFAPDGHVVGRETAGA